MLRFLVLLSDPRRGKNLVLVLREEFHLEETNSHQGNSLVLVRDTDSPLGAKVLMRGRLQNPVGECSMPTTMYLGKEPHISPQQVTLKREDIVGQRRRGVSLSQSPL